MRARATSGSHLARNRTVTPYETRVAQRKAASQARSDRRLSDRKAKTAIKAAKPPRPPRFHAGAPRRRLIASLLLLVLLLTALLVRVGLLQTTEAADLRNAGSQQWTRSSTVAAQRGSIFDRTGNELAMSIPAVTVSVNPQEVVDERGTAQLLGDLLGLDETDRDELRGDIGDKERAFAYVARQVEPSLGEQIDALDLHGVYVTDEDRRIMPGGTTGASVIGGTDIDGNGIAGLEAKYDEFLTGQSGEVTRQVAPDGRSIPGSENVIEQAQPGKDLVLALDRSLQFTAEAGLLDRVESIKAKGGSLVVMDTDSGDILAMTSVKRQDDGSYEVSSGNYAAVDTYEPGSVAKAVTIASALDAGVVKPSTTFVVPWQKQYFSDDPLLLSDAGYHPTQPMTVEQILVASSNIGTITVSEEMGVEKQVEYMRDFGFGEVSPLGFPGESGGILEDAEDLQGTEMKTIAYGQGVSVTAVQLVAAINAIANDGTYVSPRLVVGSVAADGELRESGEADSHRVVSTTAARQTAQMLKGVVCRGTATRAQVASMPIAGKTGTGLKAQPNGTYFDDKGNKAYYASFVGFMPADDPQVTMLISIDEPPAGSGDRFGGTAAAPMFAQLAPALIQELGLTPPAGGNGCTEGP
ncbi:MAG: penicillin-binding protein 2 [Actinomycetota bacterium]|nr:penicillin-binding protein 2 [Actinomycetota bacterium]